VELAAAAGLVLLAITLLLNGTAIWLRYRLRRSIQW
jgi:phosphate transport system permease protein